jgi:hypothetical protein
MVSSFGGGLLSLVISYFQHGKKIDVMAVINGVLGALVSVTGRVARFFVTQYTKTGVKYTKLPPNYQNIPNCRYVSQMVIKYTNIFHSKAL